MFYNCPAFPMKKTPKPVVIHPDDPREVPLYNLTDAAQYLGIPVTTLRSWTKGRTYPTKQGRKIFRPLIELADPHRGLMSFANLAEAHVLQATRDKDIPIPHVRRAIDYIGEHWPSRHPLIAREFLRFGKQLFVREIEKNLDSRVNVSKSGQLGLTKILDQCLERLERDDTGYPIRIFPLGTKRLVLDVHVASGQPVIKNTRLLAGFLWRRNKAGDSIEELAKAYRLRRSDVKEAIQHFQAAA
jgi:uncharacterized protein (DUF433 family)